MPAIIGLGNVGAKYEGTRHNIGFEIVDILAEMYASSWKKGPGPYLLAQTSAKGQKTCLVKPTTFMNLSGDAVGHLASYYKIPIQECLVCTDDISLPQGKIRLRAEGGAGGHNGLKHIIERLGSQDFPRLRFGVGDDFHMGNQANYVLSLFSRKERENVDVQLRFAADAATEFVTKGIASAMNLYN